MKVLGIPVSDINLGSSRLRYFYLLQNLPDGWEWGRYSKGADGDVLYIQKCETPEVKRAIEDCKSRGIPVVYERDDFCKPWNKAHTKIMNKADAVTIITKAAGKTISKHTKTPVYHVPDGMDYNIKPSDRATLREEMRSVISYGRQANTLALKPYYRRLDMKKAYICNVPCLPSAKFYEWKLDKVVKRLVKYDLLLCVHADTFRKKYKDAGRAILGMALGIPTIATKNIETCRVYREAGHPELLVNTPSELYGVVQDLKSLSVRRKVSDDCFEYAWANWRNDIAAAKLAQVFERVISEKNALPRADD